MTMHISPTSSDPAQYLARTGLRPVVHLDRLGVLGAHLLLAHGVWLDDEEIDLILSTRTAIAYCPWAYLRLGQGVRGSAGTPRSSNAAVASRWVATPRTPAISPTSCAPRRSQPGSPAIPASTPQRFGAHQAFELATIAGAEAIGMADRIGSLEVGKQADIVVHDASGDNWTPRGDVAMQLVWGTDGRSVRDVFVAGRTVIRDGRCVTVDVGELRLEAQHRQRSLLDRAGITVPHVWPHVDAR